MSKQHWIKRWKNWVAPSALPGVWKVKKGGYLVRARVKDPTTGRLKEIKKVLPEVPDATVAWSWLVEEHKRVQKGSVLAPPPKQHFADYAVSLLERKVAKGELGSRVSQDRWKHTLEHLIAGTSSDDGERTVAGFGELYVEQIRSTHVEAWKEGVGRLIHAGQYSPATANSWLAVLRVILKSAQRDFELPAAATNGVGNFDTSNHETYTAEEPNSLAPGDVPRFLSALREQCPQHYAMVYLGFATGLRPSSLRPLRRRGETPDVLWDKGRLLVRRSQTRGDDVMNTTKQKRRYVIDLPEEVMAVLRWHVEAQLVTPEQQDSELLFPSITGGYRTPTVLNKPFKVASDAIGLGYAFTQRGMRRTFNDLARAAEVEGLVTRSISGHLTERMQEHYSTVRGDEQRQGITRVAGLMTGQAGDAGGAPRFPLTSTLAAPAGPLGVPSGAPGGTPMRFGGAPAIGMGSPTPQSA